MSSIHEIEFYDPHLRTRLRKSAIDADYRRDCRPLYPRIGASYWEDVPLADSRLKLVIFDADISPSGVEERRIELFYTHNLLHREHHMKLENLTNSERERLKGFLELDFGAKAEESGDS